MNNVRSSSRKRIPALQNPDDPRWDYSYTIPVSEVIRLLVLGGKLTRQILEQKGGRS